MKIGQLFISHFFFFFCCSFVHSFSDDFISPPQNLKKLINCLILFTLCVIQPQSHSQCEGLAAAAEMCVSLRPISEITLKHFQGAKVPIFTRFAWSLLLILFSFAFFPGSGFCSEIPLVSEPLGFQINGFDRARVWVSPNGLFAFGFLDVVDEDESSGGDGLMLGIRYNLGHESAANVPVWTVGGGVRVPENSTLSLSENGQLVLVDNFSNLIVWSSNSSELGVQKVTLLNNGNLVLMDSMSNVVWESFNSPTNTLLPGQSLRFPQSLRAPSTKSIASYYSCVIHQSSRRHFGELALVWESNVTYWRSSPSAPGAVNQVSFDSDGVLKLVDDYNMTLWSKASQDMDDHTVTLRHLRMDRDGNLRIYSWNRETRTWRVGWQAVQDQCNVFASCGLYSVCGYNSTGPVCDCLYQDPLNSAKGSSLGMELGSSGCRKMVDLNSCRTNTSMMPIKHTSLYAVYPPEEFQVMLSEMACKEYCSNDTTCIAVTSMNDGSGLCTVKRTNFISGSSSPSIPATSYLKVCLVPQAVATGGANPHRLDLMPPSQSERSKPGEGSTGLIGGIAVVVIVTVCGFLAMELSFIGFFYRKRKLRAKRRIPFGKDAQMNPHYSIVARLSYAEVEELAQNFSNPLGPSVFKGLLPSKVAVVVKVLTCVTALEKEFRITVSTLGGIHHRNLVPLKGFCFEPKHKCLIYEYVSNDGLDKWLLQNQQAESPETWLQKLSIATGIARAIAYLHLECQRCIPHGNLKLHNIMLDENSVPKVTDYGLQSLFQKGEATSSESPSEKDIYAFGVLVLQIISYQPNSITNNLCDLIEQVNLRQTSNCSNEQERMRRIALWCVQNQPFLRPSIGEVVKVLEGTLTVDIPPSPFGSRQPNQTEVESSAELQSSGEIRVEVS